MAVLFTYDPSWPADRDWIRSKVGDTDSSVPLMDDLEIDALIAETAVADPQSATAAELRAARSRAALEVCQRLLAKLALKAVDTTIGDQRVLISQKFAQVRQVMKDLRDELGLSAPGRTGGVVPLVRV